MNRRTAPAFVTALAVCATGLVTATASPAAAVCKPPDGAENIWYFTNIKKSSLGTTIASNYLKGPGTISYSTTKAASVNATMSASVSAEAGVVFAKASTTMGVSVGKTWSKDQTWTYSKAVPKGKTARLRLYQQSRSFSVEKKYWDERSCKYKRVYKGNANAPRKTSVLVWRLQYLS